MLLIALEVGSWRNPFSLLHASRSMADGRANLDFGHNTEHLKQPDSLGLDHDGVTRYDNGCMVMGNTAFSIGLRTTISIVFQPIFLQLTILRMPCWLGCKMSDVRAQVILPYQPACKLPPDPTTVVCDDDDNDNDNA